MKQFGNPKGLTILELLVWTFVTGVLVSASLPSLSALLGASHLESAARTTSGYLRVVRAAAVTRNASSRLVVDPSGATLRTEVQRAGSWQVVGDPVALDGVTVSAMSPVSTLVFTPQGTTGATTTLTLRNERGDTTTVRVSLLGSVEAG